MDHMEQARALRGDTNVHYNCCQSVLVPFAGEMGLTPEQANALGAHLGAGMRHGSVCGALSGALLALGALGFDQEQAHRLLRQFRQSHGCTDCANLLKASLERGEVKKDHCDGLVYEMVQALDAICATGEDPTDVQP